MLPGIEVGGSGAAFGLPFACSLVDTVAAGCGCGTKKIIYQSVLFYHQFNRN